MLLRLQATQGCLQVLDLSLLPLNPTPVPYGSATSRSLPGAPSPIPASCGSLPAAGSSFGLLYMVYNMTLGVSPAVSALPSTGVGAVGVATCSSTWWSSRLSESGAPPKAMQLLTNEQVVQLTQEPGQPERVAS